jgi:hypothetical protein
MRAAATRRAANGAKGLVFGAFTMIQPSNRCFDYSEKSSRLMDHYRKNALDHSGSQLRHGAILDGLPRR